MTEDGNVDRNGPTWKGSVNRTDNGNADRNENRCTLYRGTLPACIGDPAIQGTLSLGNALSRESLYNGAPISGTT